MTRCSASPAARLVAETDRDQLTPEHRFKTAAEMAALFADLPEAIDNTIEIARRCAFRPKTRKPILPRFRSRGPMPRMRKATRRRIARARPRRA